MNHFDVEQSLQNMVILADTREHPNAAYRKRIKQMGVPVESVALSYGDYSCRTVLPDGTDYTMTDKVAVERKMSLDEVCGNFGRNRKRFIAEFERAKADGARVYLLIEGASWTDIFAGKYRSRYSAKSLFASIIAWIARYGSVPIFCQADETGKIIAEIMKRELKERLEAMNND